MNKPLIASFIALSFFLSGCQSKKIYITEQHNEPTSLLRDELFSNQESIQIETPEQIFALNDDIRKDVQNNLLKETNFQRRAEKMIQYIFGKDSNNLAYQNNATMIAQEAFNKKTANCISLTILAYSLAEFSGLEATFQDVQVPEYWVRNGAYNMLSGHVNLLVKQEKKPLTTVVFGNKGVEIDFDPYIQKQNFSKKVINKNTVTAMFYNNKGAMALIDKQYDRAYKYFKAAINISPDYPGTWANLGILYRFNDYNALAEQSYRHAISIAPNNLNTLTNLSILLEMRGDIEESRKIDQAIIKHRINNPYYHALLADEALYDKDFESALKHFNKALKLDPRIHEFHFGMAKVYLAQGNISKAQTAMKKAIKTNRTPSIDDKYIAKLEILKRRD